MNRKRPLSKDALSYQPALSRFFNRMDEDTLSQVNQIMHELRKVIHSIKKPEFMLLGIDSRSEERRVGKEC